MASKNPYIGEVAYTAPLRKYTLTFVNTGLTLEVDPHALPEDSHGLPGSILDIALSHGVELDHACGGVCACSTCHVYVREGASSCNVATDAEEDMLDNAPNLIMGKSRLACQCVPDGSQSIRVEIPGWNRNLAKESAH